MGLTVNHEGDFIVPDEFITPSYIPIVVFKPVKDMLISEEYISTNTMSFFASNLCNEW